MSYYLKSEKEIKIMKEGGKRLRKIASFLIKLIKPGIKTQEIDYLAEKLIKKFGGYPSFKMVSGYHWSTCISVNEQIVHTPPSSRTIKEGDLVTLDMGMYYQGYHTDWATTVIVGKIFDQSIKKFLETGKSALKKAILKAKAGNRLGEICLTIQEEIEKKNHYFVIRELTGHGVGKKLHEDPFIPGYLDKPIEKTPVIKAGMTLAVEVIYSQKPTAIKYEDKNNHWSLVTENGCLSACFEHTIAVLKNRTLILT